jgi:hypothetical protein
VIQRPNGLSLMREREEKRREVHVHLPSQIMERPNGLSRLCCLKRKEEKNEKGSSDPREKEIGRR